MSRGVKLFGGTCVCEGNEALLTIFPPPHPYSEAFDLFDTDGAGAIDAKELKVAMR